MEMKHTRHELIKNYLDFMIAKDRKIRDLFKISGEDLYLRQLYTKELVEKYNLSDEDAIALEPLLDEFYCMMEMLFFAIDNNELMELEFDTIINREVEG